MPERVFKLNNTSFEIIRLCDGEHTVQQIAEKLQKVYSAAEPQRIADDVFEYLASLRDERAIDF
jgi:pyrroloquinoline quinone biosynthesis protein D